MGGPKSDCRCSKAAVAAATAGACVNMGRLLSLWCRLLNVHWGGSSVNGTGGSLWMAGSRAPLPASPPSAQTHTSLIPLMTVLNTEVRHATKMWQQHNVSWQHNKWESSHSVDHTGYVAKHKLHMLTNKVHLHSYHGNLDSAGKQSVSEVHPVHVHLMIYPVSEAPTIS